MAGLVATHLLYLHMRRRGWLQEPGSKLLRRFSCVLPLMAAILNAIDWIFAHFVEIHSNAGFKMSLPLVLVSWSNWAIVLVTWTALYFALHEFRLRRIRELHSLRMEVVAQQAQLRGLRAQLNTHFLFNCLNGLREMIGEDPGRAQVIVEQLAALLRYSLQPNQAELVSFAEEIRAVQDYLALETMRFEERLTVEWDLAPETYSVKVPPMLLQTLVENALKHGIAPSPQGGTVAIITRMEGSQMHLEVMNSGSISDQRSHSGLGLRNVRERLNLLYGESAGLELDGFENGQVRATVNIPLAPVKAVA